MGYGDRFKNLRESRKLSQQQLADALNINRSTYARYELGQTQPDFETLEKMASFYDVSVDYLLGRKSSEHKADPNDDYDSLAEIKKILQEYNVESFGMFDINEWKNLSREDVEEIRRHFEWVAHKARERNEDNG